MDLTTTVNLLGLVRQPPRLTPVNECNHELYVEWCRSSGRVVAFSGPVVWTELDLYNNLINKRKEMEVSNYERKDLSGALFINSKKDAGSRQPDYSGNALIDGVEYRIAGWKQKAKSGIVYLSLKFSEPNDDWKSGGNDEPIDDEIPF